MKITQLNSASNTIEDYVNSFVKKIVVTSKPSQDMVKNRWNRNEKSKSALGTGI